MTVRSFHVWAVAFWCGFSSLAFAEGSVTAKITGIESDKGVVRVTLFSEKIQDQFPDGILLKELATDARQGGVSVTFEVPESGYYALAVTQDENNDGKMQTNFLGIPQEPYGNSGEAAILKPGFQKSRVLVDGQETAVQIRLSH